MGLLEKLSSEAEEADTEMAHEVLESIEEGATRLISPTRVIFASLTVVLLLSASLFVLTWIVPYVRVSLDVVYRQGGPGHVVAANPEAAGGPGTAAGPVCAFYR